MNIVISCFLKWFVLPPSDCLAAHYVENYPPANAFSKILDIWIFLDI